MTNQPKCYYCGSETEFWGMLPNGKEGYFCRGCQEMAEVFIGDYVGEYQDMLLEGIVSNPEEYQAFIQQRHKFREMLYSDPTTGGQS